MELKGLQWHIDARPIKIDDVYGGSSSIIDTMIKPFVKTHAKDDKWPRGILLMGKSGGGKTTIAKIIAMTMVCKHLDKDGNPCGVCPDCKSIIEETWNRDVKLIDATTIKGNEGSSVEGMQKLVQESRSLPFFGSRHKVIIIDEIQELLRGSMKASINTLLKELEKENSKTCWIFTSMDNIKATGATVETELGNGNGYGSSGQSGFLRRVTQFKFTPLSISDLMKYLYTFAHQHTYGGTLLWDWMVQNGGKVFCTAGLKSIAEGSIGSIGIALKNLQACVDSKIFDLNAIEKFIGVSPEVKILDAVVSLATDNKSDEAFMQLSGISQDNFVTVYQIMMSEIRRAEMVRVFNKIGTLKVKDGKEELKITDDKTDGPEKISFNRAKQILNGKNYTKLRDVLINLNQDGYFTLDLFKVKLLSVYS